MVGLIVIALIVLLPILFVAWRLRRSQEDVEPGGSDGKQISGK